MNTSKPNLLELSDQEVINYANKLSPIERTELIRSLVGSIRQDCMLTARLVVDGAKVTQLDSAGKVMRGAAA